MTQFKKATVCALNYYDCVMSVAFTQPQTLRYCLVSRIWADTLLHSVPQVSTLDSNAPVPFVHGRRLATRSARTCRFAAIRQISCRG